MQAFIDSSILDLLPDPVEALPTHPIDDKVTVRHFGGLHNISYEDKLRWRDDSHGNALIILETSEDAGYQRGEFFPSQQDMPMKNGYRIQYVSFRQEDDHKVITSHNKYLNEKHPIASTAFVMVGGARMQQPVLVWHKDGRLHSQDFVEPTNSTQYYSVYAQQYVLVHEKHDYLNRIVFKNLKEIWEHGRYVRTIYDGYQIVLRSDRTPEDNDPSINEWIERHCKHGFNLLSPEPFGDEEEEFNFLTDLAF